MGSWVALKLAYDISVSRADGDTCVMTHVYYITVIRTPARASALASLYFPNAQRR